AERYFAKADVVRPGDTDHIGTPHNRMYRPGVPTCGGDHNRRCGYGAGRVLLFLVRSQLGWEVRRDDARGWTGTGRAQRCGPVRTEVPRVPGDPAARLARRAAAAHRRHPRTGARRRSEEHTSELQSLTNLVCRLLL